MIIIIVIIITIILSEAGPRLFNGLKFCYIYVRMYVKNYIYVCLYVCMHISGRTLCRKYFHMILNIHPMWYFLLGDTNQGCIQKMWLGGQTESFRNVEGAKVYTMY